MGSSSKIISMFPWWLEWTFTMGMRTAEPHIREDAFIAIATEVFFLTREHSCGLQTRLTKTTFVSKVRHAATCWGEGPKDVLITQQQMWSESEDVLMRHQSGTHGSPSHLQPAWTHWSCHQRVAAATRLPAQTVRPHQNLKQRNRLKQTASTAPWQRSQFVHIRGGKSPPWPRVCVCVVRWVPLSYEQMTYPLMHWEMCKARRVRELRLSFWTCVRTYWRHARPYTKGCVSVCGRGMVMQWQENHTYFPVRESLSLLWDRKTTSMTQTHVHTQNKRRSGV